MLKKFVHIRRKQILLLSFARMQLSIANSINENNEHNFNTFVNYAGLLCLEKASLLFAALFSESKGQKYSFIKHCKNQEISKYLDSDIIKQIEEKLEANRNEIQILTDYRDSYIAHFDFPDFNSDYTLDADDLDIKDVGETNFKLTLSWKMLITVNILEKIAVEIMDLITSSAVNKSHNISWDKIIRQRYTVAFKKLLAKREC